jgi:CRP-like cAMP-binding protein
VQTSEYRQYGNGGRPDAIARRLGALAPLSPMETDLLRRVGAGPASIWPARSRIEQAAGNHPSLRYLISGWATCVRELNDGRRQILQVYLPGDALEPHMRVRDRIHSVHCITTVRAVDGGAIRLAAREVARFPGISAAVELAAAHDRALLLEHVTRLGRQSAYERIANFFVELHYRIAMLEAAPVASFSFPLTQELLGDLLGLSVVHVNRTLQLMRQQGVIALRQGQLALLDLPALQQAAEFKPPALRYLN